MLLLSIFHKRFAVVMYYSFRSVANKSIMFISMLSIRAFDSYLFFFHRSERLLSAHCVLCVDRVSGRVGKARRARRTKEDRQLRPSNSGQSYGSRRKRHTIFLISQAFPLTVAIARALIRLARHQLFVRVITRRIVTIPVTGVIACTRRTAYL